VLGQPAGAAIRIADYLAVGALQAFIPCHQAWDEFDKIFSDLVLGKGCVLCTSCWYAVHPNGNSAASRRRLEQSSAPPRTGYQFHHSSIFLESLRDQATCKWGMKRGSMILLKVHTCVKHLLLSLQHWNLTRLRGLKYFTKRMLRESVNSSYGLFFMTDVGPLLGTISMACRTKTCVCSVPNHRKPLITF